MNNTAYSQSEFEARQQERAEQVTQELAGDSQYQAALSTLNTARGNLAHLQELAKAQPTIDRRLAYNESLTEARQAVTDAEKAAQSRKNEFLKTRRLHQLEEQQVEREKAQAEQQQKRAQELEQEMKAEYRAVWQGDQASFDAAWPGLYQRELETRAIEQRQAVKHNMGQRYAL